MAASKSSAVKLFPRCKRLIGLIVGPTDEVVMLESADHFEVVLVVLLRR
jgi:hypothetical protein